MYADGLGLRMVFKTKAVQLGLHQFGRQFAVGCIDRQQSAANDPLRRATLVDIDMCRLGTHHRLVRTAHGINAQHIGPCSIEHQIYTSLRTKRLPNEIFQSRRHFVVSICQSMAVVGAYQSLHHLGAETRVVVTSKSSFHQLNIFCKDSTFFSTEQKYFQRTFHAQNRL